MKEILIKKSYFLEKFSELEKVDQDLIKRARNSCVSAYAPYSGFQVGSSILLDNGKIITASNQENVAYPSGLCAERVAIFYASSRFPESKILTIAVSAISKDFKIDKQISPCGSCRQVMSEYEVKQKKIYQITF